MSARVLACALLLAAGCGGGGTGDGGDATPRPGPPREAPPEQPRAGPPPAWIATPEGSFWLAYSTYCWTAGGQGVCADFVAPSCEDSPEIPARVGEPVRVHFGFEARSPQVTFFPGGARQPLDGLEWIVESGGAFAVSAQGDEGDASYAGCLVVSGAR